MGLQSLKTLRVLLHGDHDLLEDVRQGLGKACEEWFRMPKPELAEVATPEDFARATEGTRFDLFFVRPPFAGIVPEAVLVSGLALVGLGWGKEGEKKVAQQRREFYACGGHHWLLLEQMREWSAKDTARFLQDTLLEHGKSIGGRLSMNHDEKGSWDSDEELKLAADLQEIGPAVVCQMVEDMVPIAAAGCSSFTPRYVSKGYSGAVVLRATTDNNTHILVKASRDGHRLDKELRKSWSAQSQLYIQYYPELDEPVRRAGWYAIAAGFTIHTMTLQDWLTVGFPPAGKPGAKDHDGDGGRQPPPADTAETAVRMLFQYLKGYEYDVGRDQRHREINCKVLLDEAIGTAGRARVAMALDELQAALRSLPLPPNSDYIKDVLRRHRLAASPLEDMKFPTHKCPSHGDLHARNILVSATGEPRLIDPARRAVMHWASDAARLSVDLWMNAWNREAAMRLDPDIATQVEEWRGLIRGWTGLFGQEAPQQDRGRDSLVLQVLHQVKLMAEETFEDVYDNWEFGFALVPEFLLHSSYQGLPTPKRCLAICLAGDLLSRLEETWPDFKKRRNALGLGGASPQVPWSRTAAHPHS